MSKPVQAGEIVTKRFPEGISFVRERELRTRINFKVPVAPVAPP
jgi:hypothetical protein